MCNPLLAHSFRQCLKLNLCVAKFACVLVDFKKKIVFLWLQFLNSFLINSKQGGSTSPSEGETTRNKPIPKITYEQPPGIFNPEYKLERVRHYHFFSKCLLL